MSEERSPDWVANYDQVRAEAEAVLRSGKRFLLLWLEEEVEGEAAIGSAGIVQEDDTALFIRALLLRAMSQEGVLPVGPPPEGWGA